MKSIFTLFWTLAILSLSFILVDRGIAGGTGLLLLGLFGSCYFFKVSLGN